MAVAAKKASSSAGPSTASAEEGRLSFQALQPALKPSTIEAVSALGFKQMTPVQAATLPLFLTNKDVCVEAVTGSGKTLAFAIPVIEIILRRSQPLKKHQIGAIVISPTRELAKQTFKVMTHFCNHAGLLPPLLLVGGTDVEDNFKRFTEEGADVLVATPGRLGDLLERYDVFDMRELEVLVLDEADVLLDMGFKPTLSAILARLPKQRRTGLFSATQTREVRELARAGMRNPATIALQVVGRGGQSVQATPQGLENFYLVCEADQKLARLVRFLKEHKEEKVMVFFTTCAAVDYFSRVLPLLPALKKIQYSDRIWSLHGKMVQKKRDGMYARFSQSPTGALLCTDVAARGIDIPDIDWIIQFEPPQDPSFFIHRVGRTARAGRAGKSLTFLLPVEDPYIEFLRLKQVPLSPLEQAPLEEGEADRVLEAVRKMAHDDREVLERGTRAYTAFVRAYKEHQCQFIFRFAKLDLTAVARAYALLRLPRMPELAHHPIPVNFQEFNTDTRGITFKDKAREAARQARLAQQQLEQEQQEKKRKREEGAAAKDGAKAQAADEEDGKRKRKKRKGKHQQLMEEWDELGKEERLFKKLRNKKISKEEYERALRAKDDDEESGSEGGGSGSESMEVSGDSDADSSDEEEEGGGKAKKAGGRAAKGAAHHNKGQQRQGQRGRGRGRGGGRGHGGRHRR